MKILLRQIRNSTPGEGRRVRDLSYIMQKDIHITYKYSDRELYRTQGDIDTFVLYYDHLFETDFQMEWDDENY